MKSPVYDARAPVSIAASAVVRRLRVRGLLGLVDEVCARRGVLRADICGRPRSQSVSRARQEVWWLIRHDAERYFSRQDLAQLFARDHTTILAGIAAHERRRRFAAK